MNYTKINITKLKRQIKVNEVNSTTAELLLSTAELANEIINKFESNEVDYLIKVTSREGNDKWLINPILNTYFQAVSTIDKLLKSGKIIKTQYIPKPKEEEEIKTPEDGFTSFLNKIEKRN